ncbi:MAG: TfoX/Sxy family protein [Clostridia bacterium]|nr:TfoX/Sxy family protein [Clostridia bacterium]
MPASKDYLAYILDQLSDLPGVESRAMMGEYLLYYQGKLIGGLYDNRFLIKPVPPALALLPDAPLEPPYPGAKPMALVEETDDRALLQTLVRAVADALPAPKKRGKGNSQ